MKPTDDNRNRQSTFGGYLGFTLIALFNIRLWQKQMCSEPLSSVTWLCSSVIDVATPRYRNVTVGVPRDPTSAESEPVVSSFFCQPRTAGA